MPDFQATQPEAIGQIREVPPHTLSEDYAMACEALRDFDLRGKLGTLRRPTLAMGAATTRARHLLLRRQ
jgi:3-oxoadipate enol-lactonase